MFPSDTTENSSPLSILAGMLFPRLFRFGFLPVLISGAQQIHNDLDPCSKIAGKRYVEPLDAESCLSSFPFNDTLKNNVLSIVSGSLDFFTWEAHYLNLPPPFHKESWDIRAGIRRINQTRYDVCISLTPRATSLIDRLTAKTDYQFNRDLFEVVNRLNDGHTCTSFCRQVASFMTFCPRQISNRIATLRMDSSYPPPLSFWTRGYTSRRILLRFSGPISPHSMKRRVSTGSASPEPGCTKSVDFLLGSISTTFPTT